jgi:hypothetical protein
MKIYNEDSKRKAISVNSGVQVDANLSEIACIQ